MNIDIQFGSNILYFTFLLLYYLFERCYIYLFYCDGFVIDKNG